MKRLFLPLILFALIFGCNTRNDEGITEEQKKQEEAIIAKRVEDYHKAYAAEDFLAIHETLASGVVFFGSDSAECFKTRDEFKTSLEKDWKIFDFTFGPIFDKYIEIDKKGTVATIYYGIHYNVTYLGEAYHIFMRGAKSLKKEKGTWPISSGIMGVSASEQSIKSYTDLTNKVKSAVSAPVEKK